MNSLRHTTRSPKSRRPTRSKVRGVIRGTRLVSLGLGVVLSPIPFADELVLLPVYGAMTAAIARAQELGGVAAGVGVVITGSVVTAAEGRALLGRGEA